MKYLKNKLFRTYGNNHDKPDFTLEDLKDNWREVQKEYPIILSTTFSSVSSLHQDTVYDYLIMDKASQVSVETGALALSYANNAIIVGDTMQLPNVVTEEDKEKLDFIANACLIKAEYDCARMSFLQSVCKVISNVPQTLLREHYRCHPNIICHLPLYMLIQDYSLLNAEESKYAANINTHIDFLIYNRVSKQPILAIETDGYMYHKSGTRQAERDVKKDHILELYGILLVRLSTIGSNEKKIIVDKLCEVLHSQT